MKILLLAINAKYIHSSLAVNSLAMYSKEYGDSIEVAEFTINNSKGYITEEIYKKNPDVIAFSCYIWNYSYVREIAGNLIKILPAADIWFGGPEVSYDSEDVIKELAGIRGVMRGEGEITFHELAKHYIEGSVELKDIDGISFVNDGTGEIISNKNRQLMNLDDLPFCYEDLTPYQNKIIYYEGSRGCPFSCCYCLSSVDKTVRFKSLDKIKAELLHLIKNNVPQVKFVDRTFNCRHEYTKEIWRFLIENDNGITNFHFEISADLLDDEEIRLVSTMRPGLIQMETGIQSTNPDTIKAINRHMDYKRVAAAVRRIAEAGNIHQHLDLIAGLPFEGYERFKKSYDDVYELRPNQLQLGFLKVLKGSNMHALQKEYEIKYLEEPPYEVLSTKFLTYGELILIKIVEEMTEIYYNSGQFDKSLIFLKSKYESAFEMFLELGQYYEEKGLRGINHSRLARYNILRDFVIAKGFCQRDVEIIEDTMLYDLYLRENLKSRPEWAKEHRDFTSFYTNEDNIKTYLGTYEKYEYKQVIRMTHMESFLYDYTKWKEEPVLEGDGVDILFDYKSRSPLDNSARVVKV